MHPAVLTVGVGSAAATMTGASVAAASASTVILATGGAAAFVLIGYGIYRLLSSDATPRPLPPRAGAK